jgi:hypothetical protein
LWLRSGVGDWIESACRCRSYIFHIDSSFNYYNIIIDIEINLLL